MTLEKTSENFLFLIRHGERLDEADEKEWKSALERIKNSKGLTRSLTSLQ